MLSIARHGTQSESLAITPKNFFRRFAFVGMVFARRLNIKTSLYPYEVPSQTLTLYIDASLYKHIKISLYS